MLTVALQAGGTSRRMGHDKAQVLLDGRPLITHVLERAAPLADEVMVTTNAPQEYAFLGGVRLAPDAQPGAGALAGLRTALRAASHEHVLVLACDLPFLCVPLLEHLLPGRSPGRRRRAAPARRATNRCMPCTRALAWRRSKRCPGRSVAGA